MIKTKFTGVYYRDLQNNDRVFIITYKLNGKFKKEKVDAGYGRSEYQIVGLTYKVTMQELATI